MRNDEPIRLLLVGGDPDLLAAVHEVAGPALEIDAPPDRASELAAIAAERHDVYLVAVSPETLGVVREGVGETPRAPLICVISAPDPMLERRLETLGAADLLLASELGTRLERSIRLAMHHHRHLAELAADRARFATAAHAAAQGVWEWDVASDRVYVSAGWHAVLGAASEPGELTCEAWLDLVHPRDLLRLRATIDAHVHAGGAGIRCEHRIRHTDGGWRWVRTCAVGVRDGEGAVRRITGTIADVTHEHDSVSGLSRDALRDALTGLPSRGLVIDRADQLLRRARRDPACAPAVLMIDIDSFRRVEHEFSRAIGDGLLVAMGRRLASLLRPGDTAARSGDDEFTVLLDGAGGVAGAKLVADRVLAALQAPFAVDGRRLLVSATIGIACALQDVSDGEELISRAETAMYDAKRSARAGCAVFGAFTRASDQGRPAREAELRRVIDDALLAVHYQPIVDLVSGRVRAFEALARWPSDAGVLSPLQFVPIAEDLGLIGALSTLVIGQALEVLSRWRRAGLVGEAVCMSVNLSGRQLDDPQLPALIRTALAAGGLPAEVLRLEITERVLAQESEGADRRLSEICGSGVALHLDDFGTATSSLSTLSRLGVQALKIDRSVVATLGDAHSTGEAVTRSTVALARSLGVLTIAEGVEEEAQLHELRELGCDCVQGFLISPPRAAHEIQQFLLGRHQPLARVLA